jgi:DNA invertase Pin-like site-specific DNA recombinase
MRVAIYARVSTDDKNQDPETQLFALREFCQKAEWEIVNEYVDRARAKDYKHRVRWQHLLEDARDRAFKVVLVFRLDRAFRSVNECTNTIRYWKDIGIGFKSLREDVIDTTTSQGMFILHIMAAVAELESSIISERVTAGIARTRAQGHPYGRKPKPFDWGAVKTDLDAGLTVSAVARKLGCSRQRIYEAKKEHDNDAK